jgi:hypothetical protein
LARHAPVCVWQPEQGGVDSTGPFPDSVSHSLPNVNDHQVDVFGFAADVEKQEAHDEDKCLESEPFITFDI